MVTQAIDISSDPGCFSAIDPDMSLGSSSGPVVTMAPVDNTGYLDKYSPGGSMVLEYQHGLRWLTRLQTSAHPCMATEATEINSDPRYYRARHSLWQ